MSVRYICGAVMAVVLTCGAPTVARAQTQGAEILPPDQSGVVTVAGCLQRGDADHKDQYILANPIPGPVDSVSQGTCSATIDERAFDLDKTHKSGMNESMVGHWVEVSGRLERETHISLDNLRELSALSFRMVPVVPPRVEARGCANSFHAKGGAAAGAGTGRHDRNRSAGAAEDSEPASGNRIARAVYTRGRSCSSCQPASPTWVTPIEVQDTGDGEVVDELAVSIAQRCRPLRRSASFRASSRLQQDD